MRAKPSKDGTSNRWQETELDDAGRVKAVKDSAGSEIEVGYDAEGRLASLVTKRKGENPGFIVKRRADGKAEQVHSSWSNEDFRYNPDGALERVTVTSGPATAEAEFAGARLKSITQFDKGRMQFDYYDDGGRKGRIKSVQTPALALSYQYAADGGIKQVDCGAICRVNYERTDNGDIAAIVLTPINGQAH